MPQDKNRTIGKENNTDMPTIYWSTYEADFERTTKTDRRYGQEIPSGGKTEKTKILDTFVEQTGYSRKYTIHILANEGTVKSAEKRVRLKITHSSTRKRTYPIFYDKAVQNALILIWEAFNCQCGKLLAPFLHANIDHIVVNHNLRPTGR